MAADLTGPLWHCEREEARPPPLDEAAPVGCALRLGGPFNDNEKMERRECLIKLAHQWPNILTEVPTLAARALSVKLRHHYGELSIADGLPEPCEQVASDGINVYTDGSLLYAHSGGQV